MERIKFIFATACSITLIKMKLLQQLKDLFVRLTKKILYEKFKKFRNDYNINGKPCSDYLNEIENNKLEVLLNEKLT